MLEVTPLSPVLAKIAQTELNEDEKSIPQSIEILREWVKMQPHLNCPMDDKFFLHILRASKHRIEKAKDKIDSMLTLRTLIPEFFANRDISSENTLKYLRMGSVLHLPKTEGEASPRIAIMRCKDFDPAKDLLKELIKVCTLLSDLRYEIDDVHRVIGIKIVFDFDNFSPGMMAQFEALMIKKVIMYFHEVMNVRVKGLYVINASAMGITLMNTVKMFFSEKIRNRLFVFSNMKDLYDKVPRDVLPNEYGGSAGKYFNLVDEEIKHVQKNWDKIKKWHDYGVDESKRFGKPKTNEELFGVDGTFRNLEYD